MWYRRRPPCPKCGGTKQRTLSGGWANEGELPYLYVRCEDCDYHGVQITAWAPEGTGTSSIDSQRRNRLRLAARKRRGQLPQVRNLTQRKGRRLTDDYLEVLIRVIPGKLEPGLRKRIHTIRGSRESAA